MRDLLKNRNFRFLLFGSVSSKIGSRVYNVLLAIWVVNMTGSAKELGIILTIGMLPLFIFSIFSGAIVDMVNRKFLLVATDFVSGLTCIGISIIVSMGIVNIPLLAIGAFLLGLSSSIFTPTVRSIIPEIVEKDNISRANSLNSLLGQIIKVTVPIIISLITRSFTITLSAIFVINGLSFIISGISEIFIKYTHTDTRKITVKRTIEKLIEGFAFLWINKPLLKIILAASIINFFIAAFNVCLVLLCNVVNTFGDDTYSYIVSIEAAAAMIAGSFIISGKIKSNVKLLSVFLSITGVGLTIVGVTLNFYIIAFGVAVFSFSLTTFNILYFSYLQETVSRKKLGRVFSISTILALLFMPVGNLLFGFLSDYYLAESFIVAGMGIFTVALLLFITLGGNEFTEYKLDNGGVQ